MAHHKSAKKSIRKTKARTQITRARRGRLRTFVKKVEEAILQGSKETANNVLREAQIEINKSVTKGVIHLKTASRKISRLSARIKAIA
jgi:small subunit ribosomal protein S20